MHLKKKNDYQPYLQNKHTSSIINPIIQSTNTDINPFNQTFFPTNYHRHSMPHIATELKHNPLSGLLIKQNYNTPNINKHMKNLSLNQSNLNDYPIFNKSLINSPKKNHIPLISPKGTNTKPDYTKTMLNNQLKFRKDKYTNNPLETIISSIKPHQKSVDLSHTSLAFKLPTVTPNIPTFPGSPKNSQLTIAEKHLLNQRFTAHNKMRSTTSSHIYNCNGSSISRSLSPINMAKFPDIGDSSTKKPKISLLEPKSSPKSHFRINSSMGKDNRSLKIKAELDTQFKNMHEAVRLSLGKLHTLSLNQRNGTLIKYSISRNASQLVINEVNDDSKNAENSQEVIRLKLQNELDMLGLNKTNAYFYNTPALRLPSRSLMSSPTFQEIGYNNNNNNDKDKNNSQLETKYNRFDKEEICELTNGEFFENFKENNNTGKHHALVIDYSNNPANEYNNDINSDSLLELSPNNLMNPFLMRKDSKIIDDTKQNFNSDIESLSKSSSYLLQDDIKIDNIDQNNINNQMDNNPNIHVSKSANKSQKDIPDEIDYIKEDNKYFKPIKTNRVIYLNNRLDLKLLNTDDNGANNYNNISNCANNEII